MIKKYSLLFVAAIFSTLAQELVEITKPIIQTKLNTIFGVEGETLNLKLKYPTAPQGQPATGLIAEWEELLAKLGDYAKSYPSLFERLQNNANDLFQLRKIVSRMGLYEDGKKVDVTDSLQESLSSLSKSIDGTTNKLNASKIKIETEKNSLDKKILKTKNSEEQKKVIDALVFFNDYLINIANKFKKSLQDFIGQQSFEEISAQEIKDLVKSAFPTNLKISRNDSAWEKLIKKLEIIVSTAHTASFKELKDIGLGIRNERTDVSVYLDRSYNASNQDLLNRSKGMLADLRRSTKEALSDIQIKPQMPGTKELNTFAYALQDSIDYIDKRIDNYVKAHQ